MSSIFGTLGLILFFVEGVTMGKTNQPNLEQTSLALQKHDSRIQAVGMIAMGLGLFTKRPAQVASLFTAYLWGARQVPLQAHRQALEESKTFWGKAPTDPYPGFFSGPSMWGNLGTVAQEEWQSAKQQYKDSEVFEKVEEVVKRITRS